MVDGEDEGGEESGRSDKFGGEEFRAREGTNAGRGDTQRAGKAAWSGEVRRSAPGSREERDEREKRGSKTRGSFEVRDAANVKKKLPCLFESARLAAGLRYNYIQYYELMGYGTRLILSAMRFGSLGFGFL